MEEQKQQQNHMMMRGRKRGSAISTSVKESADATTIVDDDMTMQLKTDDNNNDHSASATASTVDHQANHHSVASALMMVDSSSSLHNHTSIQSSIIRPSPDDESANRSLDSSIDNRINDGNAAASDSHATNSSCDLKDQSTTKDQVIGDTNDRSDEESTQHKSKKIRVTPASAAASSSSSSSSSTQLIDSIQPAAAATSARVIAPINKLDLDSLSVCFSFLNTRDFLSSIRVNRQWRSARVKKSAWPQMHLPTLIRALQDDDYDNSERRRLVVAQSELIALMTKASSMQMWRHVTDVKLTKDPVDQNNLQARPDPNLLQQLLHFPCLAALTITDCRASDEVAQLFSSSVADRLQALGLFRCSDSLYLHLNRFTWLRVLVIDQHPDATALMQLHQLEYLHMGLFRYITHPLSLVHVIRWLSAVHQLRSLSLVIDSVLQGAIPEFFSTLLATENPLQDQSSNENASDLPLLDWSTPCMLTELSIAATAGLVVSTEIHETIVRRLCFYHLDRLPHLTRLQWPQVCNRRLALEGWNPIELLPPLGSLLESTRTCFARLQQLRLTFISFHHESSKDLSSYLRHLSVCERLRVLHVSSSAAYRSQTVVDSIDVAVLQELIVAWASTIEEIRIGGRIQLDCFDDDAYDSDWTALFDCKQLRVLEMSLQVNGPGDIACALSKLPHFHTLELSWFGKQPQLHADFLKHMIASDSWNTLHLHAPKSSGSHANPGAGLLKQLAAIAVSKLECENACERICIYMHFGGRTRYCYHISINEDEDKGANRKTAVWQRQTYAE